MSKQTLIIDSSQIQSYGECPSLWNYSYRQSMTLTNLESKDAIAMGTLGHKWLELYYYGKAHGWPQQKCVEHANAMNPDTMDAEDNYKFPLEQEKRQKVKKRLQEYWMTYMTNDYTPDYKCSYAIFVDENGMPVDGILRTPLIEQGFSYKLFESSEYLFILEGRIDFIGTQGGHQFFMDHKFQLREHRLYNKSIQFRNYALATGLQMGIINYIRLHDNVTNKTFVREPISFSLHELKVWRNELIDTYVNIAKDVKSNWFEKRRSSCAGKFGYPCEFTAVCEEPNYELGKLILIQNYKKKKEWKPW